MSTPLNARLSKKIQQTLKDAGFYKGDIDGDIGKLTQAAAVRWAESADISLAVLDPRSAGHIYGSATTKPLHQKLRPMASKLILTLRALGLDARIISGYRTYAEQDVLYAKRPRVTLISNGTDWIEIARSTN